MARTVAKGGMPMPELAVIGSGLMRSGGGLNVLLVLMLPGPRASKKYNHRVDFFARGPGMKLFFVVVLAGLLASQAALAIEGS